MLIQSFKCINKNHIKKQMDNRKQYAQEMQQRYLKFIKKEDENDRILKMRAESDNLKKELKKIKKMGSQPHLGMDTYITPKFKINNIILDSENRDQSNGSMSITEYSLQLVENLRNVVAIRLLQTEFYQPTDSWGYFVLNGAQIPLQLYNIDSAYLYLNGYTTSTVANNIRGSNTSLKVFNRIGPGTNVLQSVTGSDFTNDPYIYIFRPIEPKLNTFNIKLMQADGTPYILQNKNAPARLVLTLAVYCLQK